LETRKSRRRAVSTYLETFILIGVVIGGSALVYATTTKFSAPVQNSSSITLSDVSIRQGSGVALEKMVISNTGTIPFTSFTITNIGFSSLGPYGLVVTNTATGSAINTLTTGLVGYWPMDEGSGTSALDLSGSGNTGTLYNSPTWQSGASCKFGDCLSFAGASSQYVKTASSFAVPPRITLSIWVYATAWVDQMFGTNVNQGIMIGSVSGALYVGITTTGFNLGGSLPNNQWVQIAVTYDGTYYCGYVNGAQTTCTNSEPAYSTGTQPIWIGGNNYGGYLTGRADDVRIYNRALSSSEVSTLYSSTSPPGANAASVTAAVAVGAGQSLTVTVVVYGNPFASFIGTSQSIIVSTSAAAQQQVSAVVVGA